MTSPCVSRVKSIHDAIVLPGSDYSVNCTVGKGMYRNRSREKFTKRVLLDPSNVVHLLVYFRFHALDYDFGAEAFLSHSKEYAPVTGLGCTFVASRGDIFRMGFLGELFHFLEGRGIPHNIFSETPLIIAIQKPPYLRVFADLPYRMGRQDADRLRIVCNCVQTPLCFDRNHGRPRHLIHPGDLPRKINLRETRQEADLEDFRSHVRCHGSLVLAVLDGGTLEPEEVKD